MTRYANFFGCNDHHHASSRATLFDSDKPYSHIFPNSFSQTGSIPALLTKGNLDSCTTL